MLVLAATNVGTRQSVSLSVCLSVSCRQRAAASRQCGLCDSTDVISGLLAEFDQRFQERRILNHSSHYLPLCLLLMQNMFPKKSRWRYSICSVTTFWGSFFPQKKYPKLVSAAAEIWQCLAVCICLWTVLLIKELNEDQQICFAMKTNGQTLHATLRLATTRDFKPNVNSLASAKCCQISGQSSSETEKIWSSELCCHSYLL